MNLQTCLLIFTLIFTTAVSAVPGNDDHPVPEPSRIFRACENWLAKPIEPIIFHIAKDGRSAHIIGATEGGGGPARDLPAYALRLIRGAEHLLEFQMLGLDESIKLTHAAIADQEAGSMLKVGEHLGELRVAYLRYLGMMGIEADAAADLSPFLANSMLFQLVQVMMTDFTAEEMARIEKVSEILYELEPSVSPEEVMAHAEEVSLLSGVSALARAAGAKPMKFDIKGLGTAAVIDLFSSVPFTEEMVRALLTIEKKQFKAKSAHHATWDEMNADQDGAARLMPKNALTVRAQVREIAGAIDNTVSEHDGVLINLPLPVLPGKIGLITALRGMGYAVERVQPPRE